MAKDFIRDIITQDLENGVYDRPVTTRFPPEPNGFLHIGHAKSINLNFSIAGEFGGACHLRFDDTNPETEDMLFVESIQRDIRWLGYDWGEHLYFASDYYEQLYQFAEELIKRGLAYVDSLSEDEIREYRGTVTEPGRESPYRNRSVEENLDLFRRMRAGEFPDGAHVLRAKIDMSSPNMLLRDPILYRIKHATHYRTGDAWCIYPMYDFAHPLSDGIERITHSLCTLEFENNRAIYDWLVDHLISPPQPRQYEFARLELDYTVLSKRYLRQLVEGGYVSGWDDPRMPTISGLRRRGVTPEAIRAFVEGVGVAKTNSRVELVRFEHAIRDDLNTRAPRVLAVLNPLKVVITNYPQGQSEMIEASYWPRDIPKAGTRPVPFSREIFIERDDFSLAPPKGFKRLAPGRSVRLRHAYVITCDEVVQDPDTGEVVELHCSYLPDSLGARPEGVKVWAAIHWVDAARAIPAEVRLYDRLFATPDPYDFPEGGSFLDNLNPNSLKVMPHARVEPSVLDDPPDTRYQFERLGYFIQDSEDSRPDALVFNRIITLRDSWKKQQKRAPARKEAQPSPFASRPEPAGEADRASDARVHARAQNPDLQAAYDKLQSHVGLTERQADIITGDIRHVRFFHQAMEVYPEGGKALANWFINRLLAVLKERPITDLPFHGASFARLVKLVEEGVINKRQGQQVLDAMIATGQDPEAIVQARGMTKISDEAALQAVIAQVLAANPDKVAAYRGGKTGLIGFFMGQVMRATQGQADAQVVRRLLEAALS
ncbi:MAG TPA: glutamine--tRNA ligase/YqeY domain fusion protein [Caldilineae bacterium]|nr:glutamine--tRNA ligase/YqeY domain fusion protein [Caldilineae bacterium]